MTEPRRRLKGAQRRELIIDAARTLFAERSYDEVSIADIAVKAGVSRTVLYDHFPSKPAVLLSFLSDEITALVELIANQVAQEGSAEQRLKSVIAAFFDFISQRPLAFRILVLDSKTDEEIAAVGRLIRQQSIEGIGTVIAADADRSGIEPGIARQVGVVALTSAVQGVHQWWLENPEAPAAEVADALSTVLWNGFKGWTHD